MFRSYYALSELKTQNGLPSGAIFGMSNYLISLLSTFNPDYLIAVSDTGKPTFRHEVYSQYKANRTEAPEDFTLQIPHVFELIKTFDIPLLSQEGFEADDLAGTLCKQYSKEYQVTCVTGDMDYLQLVNKNTNIYSPQSGYQKAKLYNIEGVHEKIGLLPSQVIDFKGLKGDPSDNIPGVPGVGDKTAQKLLSEYKTLEGVYQNLESFKGKLLENLTLYKEQAFLSKELATIKQDMDISFELEDSKVDKEKHQEALSFLYKYDCHSSAKKLERLLNKKPVSEENKKTTQVQESLF